MVLLHLLQLHESVQVTLIYSRLCLLACFTSLLCFTPTALFTPPLSTSLSVMTDQRMLVIP